MAHYMVNNRTVPYAEWKAALDQTAVGERITLASACPESLPACVECKPEVRVHDFTDPYCVFITPNGRRELLCKHCGLWVAGAPATCTPCGNWRRIRDVIDAEVMAREVRPPPPPLPQGSYEPSLTGVASVGCRMVHRDRVR